MGMERKNFSEHFKGANPMAIDLLQKMLEMDADNRINADQALSHPYLAQYADPSDEPVSLPYDQTFEDFDLPVEKWKDQQKGQELRKLRGVANQMWRTGRLFGQSC